MLLSYFRQEDPKIHKKTIRFINILGCDFAKAENIIKPVGNDGFGEPTFDLVAGLSGPAGRRSSQLGHSFSCQFVSMPA